MCLAVVCVEGVFSQIRSHILKDAPLMACIINSRFKECKFLGPEKRIQVKGTLTGLVCKEKALLEEKQDSASNQISKVNEPVIKIRHSGLAVL